jgi:DNA-binding response OmpR family regulator
MPILIADDDRVCLRTLEAALATWGHQVVAAPDGATAWEILRSEEPPPLAILDWEMPGLEGPELCRRIRQTPGCRGTYVILLTSRSGRGDLVAGLESGADDCMAKPFDRDQLRARLSVGLRVIGLQRSLRERVRELEQALQRVKQLQGLLPICCYCKRIRDTGNDWWRVEEYLAAHSGTRFSHAICPHCFDTVVKEQLAEHRRFTESGGSSRPGCAAG